MQKPYPLSYSKWLQGLIPERLQTPVLDCQTCVMTKPGVARPFSQNLKCCTYSPFIPNFSLGRLLEAQGEAFKFRLQVAAQKGSLNPLGLFPRSGGSLGVDAAEGFGRDESLKCSFLDSALVSCSIWNERPGVCVSYFCPPGEFAQRKTLEGFLNTFEWTMAHEVLQRLGFTTDETDQLQTGEPVWFEWRERHFELFRACAKASEDIDREDVKELLAGELETFMKSVSLAGSEGPC